LIKSVIVISNMDNLILLFKEKKIRVTPQRLEVYRAIFGKNKHLTAEQIYEKIKHKLPAISLATIYTILDSFKEKDLVSEMRIEFDKSRFESRVSFHHHFMCKKCGAIFDIDKPPCPEIACKKIDGHSIEKLQGYFYGVCKNCLGSYGE